MKDDDLLSDALSGFADALLQARLAHRPVVLPERFAERCSMQQARAIGMRNARRLAASLGGDIVGFKLGATNPAALAKLGLERPFDGPMLSARIFRSPAALPFDDFIVCIVEAEFGVRFGHDVGGKGEAPSRAALESAIEEVFPVIELAETRLVDWPSAPPAAILADMGYFGALVVGDPVADWRGRDIAGTTVRLSVNGAEVAQGTGAAVMGHPLDALAGHVAAIGAEGRRLDAGDVITTGTWTLPYIAKRGDRIVADFGWLGRVAVDLS